MTIHTIRTENGETIRTMTPVEFQKAYTRIDSQRRRRDDLMGFAAHVADRLGLDSLTGDRVAGLVDEYAGPEAENLQGSR